MKRANKILNSIDKILKSSEFHVIPLKTYNFNHMKKIGILLIAALLFSTSCEDYLKEDNRSSITTDEFYATQGGYESLVNACYSTLRELYTDMNIDNDDQKNVSSMQGLTLLGTDLFCYAKKADQNDIMDGYFLLTPDHNWVANVFSNCYKAIQLHHLALDWEDKTVQFDALPLRVAEVRFLRAYFYHVLVEMYGAVTIVEEAFNQPVTSFERDSEEEVYAFIINELEAVKNILPAQAQDGGRATKGAAEHLLSLVYLSRGYTSFAAADDFEKAEQNATSVIESGTYNLLPSFESVFEPGNEENREIIFAIQYDRNSMINGIGGHNAHSWGGLFAGNAAGMPYRHGQIRPTDQCYLQFDKDDKRYSASFMVNQYDPYYDYYDDSKPEEDKVISQVYPHASIVNDPENPSPPNWVFLDEYTVWVPSNEEWEDDNYPWVKKFDDPLAVTRSDNSRDFFLFRLAETYLIRAEAKIKQGKSGDDDINAVRARSWDIPSEGAGIDDLLDERGRELLGECKRWMDLRRTGKIIERVSMYNHAVKRYLDQGYEPFGPQNGKALKRPIPTDAIIRDGGDYGQNVGY